MSDCDLIACAVTITAGIAYRGISPGILSVKYVTVPKSRGPSARRGPALWARLVHARRAIILHCCPGSDTRARLHQPPARGGSDAQSR